MQFGIFTVGDVTDGPDDRVAHRPSTSGSSNTVAIARKAEEVGLDVVAVGQHHNPPFVASSPTTTMAYIAAQTERIILSTSTTLITTTDPVRIAEDYATLQHLTDGRMDLMLGRGNTGPVYPWFGKDIREGIALAIENYALLHRLWREDVVDWEGRFRTPLQGFTVHAAPARRRTPVRLARLDPQPRDRRAGGLLRRRVLLQPHLLAGLAHQADGRALPPPVRALRPRHRRPGDRRARRPGVHAQEQPGRRARVPPVLRQRPGLRPRPVARGLHRADAADRRLAAAGHREDARLPGVRRRLPAPAVPDGPRRAAAEDRARAARPARRGGRARAAQGVRGPQARPRARRRRPTPRASPAAAANAPSRPPPEATHDPPHRRRQRRPGQPVLHPAARRPALGRGHARARGARRAGRGRGRSSCGRWRTPWPTPADRVRRPASWPRRSSRYAAPTR